jgi:lipopolysaccharide transport system permease protein
MRIPLLSIFNIPAHGRAIAALFRVLVRRRELTWEMAKREITDRYRGQILGTVWTVLHPLILILVYIFLFVLVFRIRIGGTRELPLDYTTYILAGLIPWLTIQDVLAKSAQAITGGKNLVKQIVFPVEVLPAKTVIASMTTFLISLVILLVYVVATQPRLFWTYALVVPLAVLLFLILIGLAFFLATIGVFFRDIKDFVQVFNFVGFFLIPMFYLPAQVPGPLRPLLYINPFSYIIWCFQDALYFGDFRHPWAWAAVAAMALVFPAAGYRFFNRLKIMFGNVL